MVIGPIWILFTATGLIFWLWFILLSLAIIWSLEYDAAGFALFSLIVGAVLLLAFSDFAIRYHISEYLTLRNFVVFVCGYALCGVAYSFLKWYLLLTERLDHWKETVAEFREKFGYADDKPVKLDDPVFKNYILKEHREFLSGGAVYNEYVVQARPRARTYKARLISWSVYWPWSLLWSLLDDIVTGFFRFMYRKLVSSYEAMSNYMFKGIE